VDELLVKASIAGQHINQYTGTDYSGIEALRKEIVAQEQTVKDFLKAYDEAKAHHHEAHAKQTGAQREIVALLERKSSWTPSDLERYMSLVRSEHLNEQDVQSAKDNLAATERNLEDARGLLERLERKQYHEEQIWSDTIRRNSTWVTFGLMGVNFLLLLAQIAIFEPYRRKKIAADVKDLLDEKASRSSVETEPEADASMLPAAEVKSVPVQLVDDADAKPTDDVPPLAAIVEEADSTPIAVADALPAKVQVVEEILETDEGRPETIPESVEHTGGTAKTTLEWYQEALLDLFSERVVQMRKVDVTNTALQGAAAGVAVMGMLFVLFRPT
jgi:sensitive to high expression protein 9